MTISTELQALVARSTTSAVSDVLMNRGIRAFMRQRIRPLDANSKMFGRACTVDRRPVEQLKAGEGLPGKAMIDAVECAEEDTVFVFNGDPDYEAALWAGLLAPASHMRAVAGIVADGPVRDPDEIMALGQPCFCTGSVPQGQKGILRLAAIDQPIACGGVTVHAGDFVSGDCNGVVVMPKGLESEVLAEAAAVEEGDQDAARLLLSGEPLRAVMARLGRI